MSHFTPRNKDSGRCNMRLKHNTSYYRENGCTRLFLWNRLSQMTISNKIQRPLRKIFATVLAISFKTRFFLFEVRTTTVARVGPPQWGSGGAYACFVFPTSYRSWNDRPVHPLVNTLMLLSPSFDFKEQCQFQLLKCRYFVHFKTIKTIFFCVLSLGDFRIKLWGLNVHILQISSILEVTSFTDRLISKWVNEHSKVCDNIIYTTLHMEKVSWEKNTCRKHTSSVCRTKCKSITLSYCKQTWRQSRVSCLSATFQANHSLSAFTRKHCCCCC